MCGRQCVHVPSAVRNAYLCGILVSAGNRTRVSCIEDETEATSTDTREIASFKKYKVNHAKENLANPQISKPFDDSVCEITQKGQPKARVFPPRSFSLPRSHPSGRFSLEPSLRKPVQLRMLFYSLCFTAERYTVRFVWFFNYCRALSNSCNTVL